MWLRIWSDCVEAVRSAFNFSPAKAKLFVAVLFTWVGTMIASTWFIWAGIIVAILVVLAVLLSIEYSLRTWYWLQDSDWQQRSVPPPAPLERSAPNRLRTPCADSEGRIEKDNLRGYAIDTMAAPNPAAGRCSQDLVPRPLVVAFPSHLPSHADARADRKSD
jgi:hypothetical protein